MSDRLTNGLLVSLEAKEGKQEEVTAVLNGALAAVTREGGTASWYAYRITETEFGIFDSFYDESGRGAHLSGAVAKALETIADDLLDAPPSIERVDILAAK
jgi:quinol monooxygenase YgiN